MDEIWKTIVDFDAYEVSNMGDVRSKDRVVKRSCQGKVYLAKLKQQKINQYMTVKNRLSVCLCKNGVKYYKPVHIIVLEAFVCKRPENMQGCHNNGIATDNRLENLRWDTKENNVSDRKKHKSNPVGDRHPRSKLTWEAVEKIRIDPSPSRQIAKKYGVTKNTILRVKNGLGWFEDNRPIFG